MRGQADTYKETKVFNYPQTATMAQLTARVHIPDLTEEQRTYRMKKVHKAAAELLRSKPKE